MGNLFAKKKVIYDEPSQGGATSADTGVVTHHSHSPYPTTGRDNRRQPYGDHISQSPYPTTGGDYRGQVYSDQISQSSYPTTGRDNRRQPYGDQISQSPYPTTGGDYRRQVYSDQISQSPYPTTGGDYRRQVYNDQISQSPYPTTGGDYRRQVYGDQIRSSDKEHTNDDARQPVQARVKNKLPSQSQIQHIYATDDLITPHCNRWYFGKIDTDRFVKIIGDRHVPVGAFIIRESNNVTGAICVSVKGSSTEVFSMRIVRKKMSNSRDQLESDNMTFPTMKEVIEHYKRCGIRWENRQVRLGDGIVNEYKYGNLGTNWNLREQDITIHDVTVGKGNFGTVKKGTLRSKSGTRVVALKVLDKQLQLDSQYVTDFEKETKVLKMVYHENIVTFLGVCSVKGQQMIVTEFMTQGDLLGYLQKRNTSVGDLYYFAQQISSGMMFLEKNDIIHRDLAARNILLGEQHLVKIADFGLSRPVTGDIYTVTSNIGLPVKWTAPEGLGDIRQFTSKSDVWSYGILLTEIITRGQEPYKRFRHADITRDRLIHQGVRMTKEELGNDCCEALYIIMSDCWRSLPEERPDFGQINRRMQHLYYPHAPLRNV